MLNFCRRRNFHNSEIHDPNTRMSSHDQHFAKILRVFCSLHYAITTYARFLGLACKMTTYNQWMLHYRVFNSRTLHVWTAVVDDMLVYNFHDLFAAQKMHSRYTFLGIYSIICKVTRIGNSYSHYFPQDLSL